MHKLSIIGAGKWGQALQNALSQNNKCFISSRTHRQIAKFISTDEALQSEFLIFAMSAQGIASWLKQNFKDKGQKILIASKGIESETCRFLDEIFLDFIDENRLCVLSGPSFAAEVMQKLPCALVISGKNETLCKEFADFFPSYIKAYTDGDIRGAEICGAYKNVLAIASGISDGLRLGNNARASLIARGLIEMARFGGFFKAREQTFLGLSGAGDLFLTASSTLSRNYRVGLALAKNQSLERILQDLGEVAEGVQTAFAITQIAQKHSIYTPIAREVTAIIKGKDPQSSLKDLLSKEV